jgi:hypothetical protein
MADKTATLSELLWTMLAFKRFITSMCANMLLQVPLSGKFGWTYFTVKVLDLFMYGGNMDAKITFLGEHLLTLGALCKGTFIMAS